MTNKCAMPRPDFASLIILDPSIHVSIILGLAVTFLVAFSMMMVMMVLGNDDESDDHWWWWWWLGSSAWIRQPAGREGSQFKGKVCPWFPSRNQRPIHIWSSSSTTSSSSLCLSIYLAEYCIPKIQYKITPGFHKFLIPSKADGFWPYKTGGMATAADKVSLTQPIRAWILV